MSLHQQWNRKFLIWIRCFESHTWLLTVLHIAARSPNIKDLNNKDFKTDRRSVLLKESILGLFDRDFLKFKIRKSKFFLCLHEFKHFLVLLASIWINLLCIIHLLRLFFNFASIKCIFYECVLQVHQYAAIASRKPTSISNFLHVFHVTILFLKTLKHNKKVVMTSIRLCNRLSALPFSNCFFINIQLITIIDVSYKGF